MAYQLGVKQAVLSRCPFVRFRSQVMVTGVHVCLDFKVYQFQIRSHMDEESGAVSTDPLCVFK